MNKLLLSALCKTKDWGFNMICKHIKVEPATWYTHYDRAGIIVWQDMPSGDRGPEWQNHHYFDGSEMKRSRKARLPTVRIQFKNSKDVTDEYVKYAEELLRLVDSGFSAAVYTQTTDVEVEVNGLMTYDRKVVKLDEDRLRKANTALCKSLTK